MDFLGGNQAFQSHRHPDPGLLHPILCSLLFYKALGEEISRIRSYVLMTAPFMNIVTVLRGIWRFKQ